jgi:hypothetical protein
LGERTLDQHRTAHQTRPEEEETGSMARAWPAVRFRWLVALLLAASLALAACDSGGESSGTATAPAKVLAPEGFSGTAMGLSAVLTWSAPTDSAQIVGYEVTRNGELLESVDPTKTTLTDFDVRPGKSYAYEIRSKGVGQLSEPAITDVEIRVPPLSAARLEGDFTVDTRLVEKSGYSEFRPFTFGWHFKPKCDRGVCNVVWRDVSDRHVRAVLERKHKRYAGDYTGVFIIACAGTRSVSSVHVSLEVKKARAIGGEWRVTRFIGTLSNSETSQFGCISSHSVQSLSGRLRLAD